MTVLKSAGAGIRRVVRAVSARRHGADVCLDACIGESQVDATLRERPLRARLSENEAPPPCGHGR
ncbi:hypothetical protein [Ralstonia pseudosolanacearum]|uniref:hypothetical protein n=1 Tax=Ralstonia pseudosolanacearum TaxID=1310165 RepID=UPI003C18E9F5